MNVNEEYLNQKREDLDKERRKGSRNAGESACPWTVSFYGLLSEQYHLAPVHVESSLFTGEACAYTHNLVSQIICFPYAHPRVAVVEGLYM
jgi:hypothetical protein